MNIVDEILKRNPAVKVLILVFIVLTVIGAYWKVFYQPLKAEVDAMEPQLNQLKADLSAKRAIVAEKDKYEAELEETRRELIIALKQLPDKSEIPSLLENISALGKESGLEFQLFRPKAEVQKNFYADIPVDIKVQGQYKDIVNFFDKVANMPRIVTISNIVMASPKADSTGAMILSTSCNATTYKFIEGAVTE